MNKTIECEIEEIKGEIDGRKFSVKRVGDTFELIGIPWKVLDVTEKGYVCIAMEPVLENEEFDAYSNNWEESWLRHKLHKEVLPKIKKEVGEECVIKFKRNMTSLDGLTEYGDCMDEISLISVDEYRKYRNLIPNSKKEWWWTITPWSTKNNDNNDEVFVAVVSASGAIYNDLCHFDNDVRPFCVFSLELFESGR